MDNEYELDEYDLINQLPSERVESLRFGLKHERMIIDFYFLNDVEWANEIENWLDNGGQESDPKYRRHVKKHARSFEADGDIYIKESARMDEDLQRLVLHELGHAVTNLWHVDRDGDIMNGDFRKWYGVKK
jgi:signal transduction protein with GAF and PtsI domain